LEYQPIVDVDQGEITAVEALVRRRVGEKVYYPDGFLPALEECGAAGELDRWVLRAACAQLAQWQQRFPHLGLNVNVSAGFVMDPAFPRVVLSAAAYYGICPQNLTIELTEHQSIDHTQDVIDALKTLRRFGISICIDDFGTGYSSLRYLQKFPVNVLKIDRSFIYDISHPATHRIVDTVLRLGRELGIRVVAEGVETIEQWACLRRCACHFAQGKLFGMPADVDTLESIYTGSMELTA
jgi:EAL domain-containing protein (putative c-di-GMP-specific phosphodiesterase class I)